jgi:superfamily II DNA or RNA helicase
VIQRYTSRLQRLDHVFLRENLKGAKSYRRIAGYFRSSLFELIHEELDSIEDVRIVCNADLDPRDIGVARSAELQAMALKEKWNERAPEADSILGRDRYRKLHALLMKGNLKVRVVGRTVAAFLHGKAGVIEAANGSKISFMGSINETREAWTENYELVWEDDSPEAVRWVEDEFDYLWAQGVDLPKAIVEEIDRCARRVEFRDIAECPPEKLPEAAMAEAPIYQRGERLMPWQQAFVGMFLDHRATYDKARMLLADEVGLGKTLSLATSALMASLLGDGPALVLCPATLTEQWQVELWDRLGVPSAVWTRKKTWMDHTGHHIKTRGAEDVARCPYQIGIVSTGLVTQMTAERQALLERSYGTLVLDEAHRARAARGLGKSAEPNNLLKFMCEAAKRARHVLLGTATPIQTDTAELWDLLGILNRHGEFVMGKPVNSRWLAPELALPWVTGKELVEDEEDAWELVRNPLPPGRDDSLFDHIRANLKVAPREFFTSKSAVDLDEDVRQDIEDAMTGRLKGLAFFQRHNPIVRHTVLRKRAALEAKGLLPKIAVDIHPLKRDQESFFVGLALRTDESIDRAYKAAEKFTALLGKRTKAAGFMKSLMLQRICSSLASGSSTAQKLLRRESLDDVEDLSAVEGFGALTDDEMGALEEIVAALAEKPEDPKLAAVWHYLTRRGWLELGCIIFSQYYDTAYWVAESLTKRLPGEPIAVYAGAGRSGIFRDGLWVAVERDAIKRAVKERELRLVVATDAACEGLNLQTLGTLINVDLPWNPSRLEQRIGRIKRFGQARQSVDMLNLVYQGTRDETVYERLSERMKDRYDLFGSLPDVIEDDWIEDIETLDLKLSGFIERKKTANAFDLRYSDTVDPKGEPWERCAEVLSRRDVVERMSRGW